MELANRLKSLEEEVAAASSSGAGNSATYCDADFEVLTDVRMLDISLPNKKGSGQDLLSGSNLTLASSRRYGLIGRNGCGKSTLMEAIAKREIAGVPKRCNLLMVRQEIAGGTETPVQVVIESDMKMASLTAFIETLEAKNGGDNAAQLAAAYERLEYMKASKGAPEPRARKILKGLGFTDGMMDQPTSKLSGGWRMRVSLSAALFGDPDILLLDEPTNHLDLEAVLWLEKYLTTKFDGTLLLVSHDRHFLNR